jgi:hypothetical protein
MKIILSDAQKYQIAQLKPETQVFIGNVHKRMEETGESYEDAWTKLEMLNKLKSSTSHIANEKIPITFLTTTGARFSRAA